jgi:hypothetical protein
MLTSSGHQRRPDVSDDAEVTRIRFPSKASHLTVLEA